MLQSWLYLTTKVRCAASLLKSAFATSRMLLNSCASAQLPFLAPKLPCECLHYVRGQVYNRVGLCCRPHRTDCQCAIIHKGRHVLHAAAGHQPADQLRNSRCASYHVAVHLEAHMLQAATRQSSLDLRCCTTPLYTLFAVPICVHILQAAPRDCCLDHDLQ